MTPQDLQARRLALTQTRDACDLLIAQQYTPYADHRSALSRVDQTGLLQMFQLSSDDMTHVESLLRILFLNTGSQVLDLGCGTGRMASLMQAIRPDLKIVLLNRSLAQLADCPQDSPRVGADMQHLPFMAERFDAIVQTYSLGYGLVDEVFAECARVLAPYGQLLIYDLICRGDQADTALVTLGYKVYPWERLIGSADAACLALTWESGLTHSWLHPAFRALPAWLLNQLLEEVAPVCVVCRRRT